MALNANDVQQLYVAYLGRAADTAGLEYWTEQVPEDFTLADLRWSLVNDQPEYQELYGDKSREELVTAIYQNMFGRDPEEAGLEYWVEGDGGAVPADELMQLFIDAASEEDRAAFDAKVEDANENPTEPTDPEEPADTDPVNFISLTAGTDRLTGTDENDKFEAYLSQNEFTGGVSNTLSSADHLDGGAGYDSLFAELTTEFRGADGWSGALQVQPRTTNIEQVEIESRDGNNALDAKHMYGVERIGSKQSDGNLRIDNLTTLANDGVTKRNTSDLTITMDHTDNTNSDGDASDLSVYFDDNYLISGQQSEFSIQLRIVNNFQLAENDAPLSGFQTVNFAVGDQQVVVDITDATTYQQVADAINAELSAQGISGVHAAPAPERTSIFSDDVPAGAGYEQGQLAGVYNPVNIVSSTEPLSNGPIELESNIENFDGLNTWVDGDSTITDDPVSVNVELTKVGRGGEGGDLVIGAKSLAQGIEVFNVTVMGEEHLPNSLGTLTSTGNDLNTINIASEAGLDSYASLEVRNGFGQVAPFAGSNQIGTQSSLELVDASAFQGDLLLGTNERIVDLNELIATGGGDVTYRAVNTDGRPSAESITQVTTGAGNDTIDVLLVGESDSTSQASSTTINAGDGDNVITVASVNAVGEAANVGNFARVTTGAGNDTVYGNNVDLTANTGAGNDAIYAENTGDLAVAQLNAGASVWNNGATTDINGNDVRLNQLLHNREVVVTLGQPGTDDAAAYTSGFETTVTVQASNGYLTTERDLYEAVARAINEDPVLSKLAAASVDSNGHLTVNSLIDGAGAVEDVAVQIDVQGDWSDLNLNLRTNIVNALREATGDSTIQATAVETAYGDAAAVSPQNVEITQAGTASAAEGGTNSINAGAGNDVIVLSSAADSEGDTVILQGEFGTNTIVHFEAGTGTDVDVLDFTFYGVVYGDTGTVVGTDYDVANNQVNVVTAGNFNTLTEAFVTDEITTAGGVANGVVNSIILVENADNLGEYMAFDVNSANGSTNFTVDLIGVLDFGETQVFDAANFA